MIEIIIEKVDMPPIIERRYRMESIDGSSRWIVWDCEGGEKKERYKGKFESASLAVYNLNKKHYRDINQNTTRILYNNRFMQIKQLYHILTGQYHE